MHAIETGMKQDFVLGQDGKDNIRESTLEHSRDDEKGAQPANSRSAKLDSNGLPLIPQPSDRRDDPLNWSPKLKLFVLLQVSWLAFLGHLGAAVVNPAFVPLSQAFGITVAQASYQLTVYIISAGLGPLLILPLANLYGRRPVYIIGNMVAAATNLAAGYCTTWPGLMITRVFNGIGAGSPAAIGAATICDMYYLHERGFYMGIFTFFLTNGPHIAPLLGGFIAQSIGWRWAYLIPGYFQLGTLIFTVFCLPESIYSRHASADGHERSFTELLLFRRVGENRRSLCLRDFLRVPQMFKYVSILIPGAFYMTSFGFGSVMFAATGANIYRQLYQFSVAQTGLMISLPLLVGCLLGEMSAGWLTDHMVYQYAKNHEGRREPEARINAAPLVILCPIGIIIAGVCLSHHETISWVGPAFGMAIANYGVQIAATITYAYCTDCYKPQSSEVSAVLNSFRCVFSMIIPFYAAPFGDAVGIQYAWLTFALIITASLIPMAFLRVCGPRWRNSSWQKPPKFHNDL